MRPHIKLTAVAALTLLAPLAAAEPPAGRGGAPKPEGPVLGSGQTAKQRTAVAWYGTWKGALAEAQRSGRPIFLIAAAPQCHGISGVW